MSNTSIKFSDLEIKVTDIKCYKIIKATQPNSLFVAEHGEIGLHEDITEIHLNDNSIKTTNDPTAIAQLSDIGVTLCSS